MRLGWIGAAWALGLFLGCTSSSNGEGDFEPPEGCPQLGTEGCPCLGGECIGDLVCLSETCVELPDDGSESDASSADTTSTTDPGDGDGDGDGDTGDTTTTSTTGDGDGDGDGDGTGGLGELDRCSSDAECGAGLVCRVMTKDSPLQRCVASCTSNAQCPSHTRCVDDGSGTNRCLGEDVGQDCTAATDCNFACLQPQNYCTDVCNSGADCPNGYACQGVGSPPINACIKLEAICDDTNTADCIAPTACDLSPTLIVGSCTSACDTAADCPRRAAGLTPWTCDGLCRRPADVYGPLPGGWNPTEWFCDGAQNPIVLCNDAQHIDFTGFTIPPAPAVDCFASVTTPGAANDSCVNSCTSQGGCSRGYSCTSVGSIGGGRIGLCLPNGSTLTGTSCTFNTECEFGYCVDGSCSRDCTFDGVCPNGTACVDGGAPAVEGMSFRRCE